MIINPKTYAEFHLDATEFLDMLRECEVKADFLIFDPPDLGRQLKEVYNGFGREMQLEDGQLGKNQERMA